MTMLVHNPVDRALDSLRGALRTLHIDQQRGRRTTITREYWTGCDWQLGTAAYWETLTRSARRPTDFRLGRDLTEELGACLLGGYGIPSPVAAAAFDRLRHEQVFELGQARSADDIERLLSAPFIVNRRQLRYRFPRQKAHRLHEALSLLHHLELPADALELRNMLMLLPGVGPKTASWVVRNHLGSNDVAIIDIHVIRAGTAAGVFAADWRVARDYALYEQAFLQWAKQAALEASVLDACIWGVLAHAGDAGKDILGTDTFSALPRPVWPVEQAPWSTAPVSSHSTAASQQRRSQR